MKVLQLLLFLALLFPIWMVSSQHAEDPKLLVVLIVFPILLFRKRGREVLFQDEGQSDIPLLILLIVNAIYLVYWYISPFQYSASRHLIQFWGATLSFCLGLRYLRDDNNCIGFLKSLSIVSAIAGAYALLEYCAVITPLDQSAFFPPHISGHVGHKNVLGFILMCGVLSSLFCAYRLNKKYYILSAFLMIPLLLIDSRASLGLALLGVFLWVIPIVMKHKLLSTAKGRFVLFGVAVLLVSVPFIFWGDHEWSRIKQLWIHSGDPFRKAMYSAQWSMIKSSPLFGNGLGAFIHKSVEFLPDYFRETNTFRHVATNGHSEYLEILSEFGLVGGGIYFSLWIGALILGIKRSVQNRSLLDYTFLVILLVSMAHAALSVASKRAPALFILWFVIAYFWFHWDVKKIVTPKIRSYIWGLGAVFTVLVTALFLQILLSDYYVGKALSMKQVNEESFRYIEKALKINSKHPTALYEYARAFSKTDQYEIAGDLIDELLLTAPNTKPVNAMKSEWYVKQGMYDSALVLIDRELNNYGGYLQGGVLKANILQLSQKKEQLQQFQQLQKEKNCALLTIREPDVSYANYKKEIGSARYAVVGDKFFMNYQTYLKNQYAESVKRGKVLQDILMLQCENELLIP